MTEEPHKLECPDCEKETPYVKTDKKKTDWFDCKDCQRWFGITEDGDIIFKDY